MGGAGGGGVYNFSLECLTQTTVSEGTLQRGPFFTHFLHRRNRGRLAIFFAEEIAHLAWGLTKSRDVLWSSEYRRRSRRERRDFGALSPRTEKMRYLKRPPRMSLENVKF